MKDTIGHLESLFYSEVDAVSSEEREEHNARLEKAIQGLSALADFVDVVQFILSCNEMSPERKAVWKSIAQSDTFIRMQAACKTS